MHHCPDGRVIKVFAKVVANAHIELHIQLVVPRNDRLRRDLNFQLAPLYILRAQQPTAYTDIVPIYRHAGMIVERGRMTEVNGDLKRRFDFPGGREGNAVLVAHQHALVLVIVDDAQVFEGKCSLLGSRLRILCLHPLWSRH
ncbi:hypothetical protein SDC9_121670 [bioreactor metagenome]|uniref:Uncharacterized protein n=1 Tax=bioreactor metagenome TaxID=1076179 RepID=A0A645CCP1_9ZZZZ